MKTKDVGTDKSTETKVTLQDCFRSISLTFICSKNIVRNSFVIANDSRNFNVKC